MWQWILYKNIQLLLLDALLNTLRAFAVGGRARAACSAPCSPPAGCRTTAGSAGPRPPSSSSSAPSRCSILIFILYFGVSRGLGVNVSAFTALVLGLMLYNGSVLAEVFRAGVASLPRGQSEAAYALGMRKTQVMTNVLLPQALRAMLPTIVSQLVVVLKDTALGFLILYPELLYQARFLGSQGQLGSPILPVAMVIAAIYITMCLLLSQFAHYLERRTRRTRRVDPAAPVDDTAVEMEQIRAGTPVTDQPLMRDVSPAHSFSRSANFWVLPVEVFGSASTNSISRGAL